MMDGLCWGDFNFSIYDEWFAAQEKKAKKLGEALSRPRVPKWAPTAKDAQFLRACNIKPE